MSECVGVPPNAKARSRRRAALVRLKKWAVEHYRHHFGRFGHDPTPQQIGLTASHNHTCWMCGNRRRWMGDSMQERRAAQEEQA